MTFITANDFITENEIMIDEYVQVSYWTDDFNADKLLESLMTIARENEIEIVDFDEFDWVGEENIYNTTEKGLS